MAEKRNFVVTIATAGTALAGSGGQAGDYLVYAAKTNTGDYVYFGNNGADDIDSGSGVPVKKDGPPGFLTVHDGLTLSSIRFDVDTSGDKIIVWKL